MLSLILAFGFVAGLYIGIVAGMRYAELGTSPVCPQSRLEARGKAQTAQTPPRKIQASKLTQAQLEERLGHLFKEKRT